MHGVAELVQDEEKYQHQYEQRPQCQTGKAHQNERNRGSQQAVKEKQLGAESGMRPMFHLFILSYQYFEQAAAALSPSLQFLRVSKSSTCSFRLCR